jgi:hypothetical protein
MTRGIQAARLSLAGAAFSEVAPLLTGEVLIGVIYIVFGYTLFRGVETISFRNGALDNL